MKKKTDLSSSTSGLVLWNVEDLRTEEERGIKSRATCYSKCILAWTYLFTAKDRKRTSAVLEVNAPPFLPFSPPLTISHTLSFILPLSLSQSLLLITILSYHDCQLRESPCATEGLRLN